MNSVTIFSKHSIQFAGNFKSKAWVIRITNFSDIWHHCWCKTVAIDNMLNKLNCIDFYANGIQLNLNYSHNH